MDRRPRKGAAAEFQRGAARGGEGYLDNIVLVDAARTPRLVLLGGDAHKVEMLREPFEVYVPPNLVRTTAGPIGRADVSVEGRIVSLAGSPIARAFTKEQVARAVER